ncbi:MAG: hypothetical protein QM758_09045 [Armatimonas sp.]
MTPEQNEQWQNAVMQAYAPDSQGVFLEQWIEHRDATFTLMALMPEKERFAFLGERLQARAKPLTEWDVPSWATLLRNRCITEGVDAKALWIFDFAFRCDIALIGIQLRYPTQQERLAAYRRLLLSFFVQGLTPVVDWVEHQEEEARRFFRDLVDLYDLISDLNSPPSKNEWQAKQRSLEHRAKAEEDLYVSLGLCYRLVEIALIVLCSEPERWWNATQSDLADCFFEVQQWPGKWRPSSPPRSRLTGVAGFFYRNDRPQLYGWSPYHFDGPATTSDAEPVAHAFLTALEAECPPPDWLPKA